MAKIDFELGEFPKNYFLFWTVSMHCANKVKVKLKDGGKTIFEANKNDSGEDLKVIKQGYAGIRSKSPELSVEVEDASKLQQSMVSGLIADDRGRRVGFVYDFCINVVGWQKKG